MPALARRTAVLLGSVGNGGTPMTKYARRLTAKEILVDAPHHRDHLACDFFLGVFVGRVVRKHVAVSARHTQFFCKSLHFPTNFVVGQVGQNFDVLETRLWGHRI